MTELIAMSTQERANQELNRLVELFSSDKAQQLPNLLKRTFIESLGKPCENWSFNNQLLCMLQGSAMGIEFEKVDARTYNQWLDVGRYVKKGEKCKIVLTKPNRRKIKDEKTDEEKIIITGFGSFCVFDLSQTEGKPLQKPKTPELPELENVAKKWNISISYQKIRGELGHYRPSTNQIVLGTADCDVFFHELAHKAHEKIIGKLSQDKEKYAEQEVIAELSACVLSQIFNNANIEKFTFDYIQHYVESNKPEQIRKMIMRVISMTGKVLKLIIDTHEEPKK